MRTIANNWDSSTYVPLLGQDWLAKQRIAGKIVASALSQLQWYVENRTFHSMATLNEVIENFIVSQGAFPTFKGYKKIGAPDFPAGVCISLNQELVHGIPKDTVLCDGDVVSFDLGATYQGAIADSAVTLIFGEPREARHADLVRGTEEALMAAIGSIEVGKHLGCIGHTINKYAKDHGFGVITNYGGHGITWNQAHAQPFVANKADPNEGIRIQSGLVIAIEPLFVLGSSTRTRTLEDGWTVICDDYTSHAEHTVYVHNDHVEIITERSNVVL
jgi:methionyl aminopeptidase